MHLQRRHAGAGRELPRQAGDGNRAVRIRRARQRRALDRQALRRLLGHWQALPRRLPRGLHQVDGRRHGAAGRTDPGGIPIDLARRAHAARQRAQGQDRAP